MRKTTIPIVIMVVANLAIILTFTAARNDSLFWGAVMVSIIIGQICLLAIWLSLGRCFGPWRLMCFVVGIQVWCYLLTIKFEFSMLDTQWQFFSFAFLVAIPIWIGRWFGLTMIALCAPPLIEPASPGKRSGQFTLSNLFAWTTSLAICLGIVSWTTSFGDHGASDLKSLLFGFDPSVFLLPSAFWIMSVYASLWLALGSRWIAARLLVFALTVTAAIIVLPSYAGVDIKRFMYCCGPAALCLISFLFARAAGYRVAIGRDGSTLPASSNFVPMLVVICILTDAIILGLAGISGNPLVPDGFFQGPLPAALALSQVGFMAIWAMLGQRHGPWRWLSLLIVALAWSLIITQCWLGPFEPDGALLDDVRFPTLFAYSCHVGDSMVNEFGLSMMVGFLLSALAVVRLNRARFVNINQVPGIATEVCENAGRLKSICRIAVPFICLVLYGMALPFFSDLDKSIDLPQLRIALAALIATLATTWAIYDIEQRVVFRLLVLAALIATAVAIAPSFTSTTPMATYSSYPSIIIIISQALLLAAMHGVAWKSGYRIVTLTNPQVPSEKTDSDQR